MRFERVIRRSAPKNWAAPGRAHSVHPARASSGRSSSTLSESVWRKAPRGVGGWANLRAGVSYGVTRDSLMSLRAYMHSDTNTPDLDSSRARRQQVNFVCGSSLRRIPKRSLRAAAHRRACEGMHNWHFGYGISLAFRCVKTRICCSAVLLISTTVMTLVSDPHYAG